MIFLFLILGQINLTEATPQLNILLRDQLMTAFKELHVFYDPGNTTRCKL